MKYNPNPQMPKVERLANPEYKKEYEMPAEYQEQVKMYLELLESRDEYTKLLSTLPPEAYRQAKPIFDELCASVDDLEEKLAFEYERYQEEQRRDQELYEMTWEQDVISEELFIQVKHQRPHIFEKFVEYATEGMTEAEREEQFAIIARREQEELEDILSGKTTAPEYENLYIKLRLPDEWLPELLFDIINATYLTDKFFETNLEALNRLDMARRDFWFHITDALPVRRENMEEAIYDMKKQLGEATRFLLEYTEEAITSGKFTPLEYGYTEYLDSNLSHLEKLIYWKYVIIKHTLPEKLEEYTRLVTEDFTEKELAEFDKGITEIGEKTSDVLLKSLEYERIADERVETRRAAPDYRKIEGPELKDREKAEILRQQERRRQRMAETPRGKIEHDILKIFNRNLKVFYAVTDGGGYAPVRYEDDESRRKERIDAAYKSMRENMSKLYIVIKHQKPEMFDQIHHAVTQDMTPEELKKFEDRIARLEAEKLEEILSGSETGG